MTEQQSTLFCSLVRALQDKIREATPSLLRRIPPPLPQRSSSPRKQPTVPNQSPTQNIKVPPLSLHPSTPQPLNSSGRLLPRPPSVPAPSPDTQSPSSGGNTSSNGSSSGAVGNNSGSISYRSGIISTSSSTLLVESPLSDLGRDVIFPRRLPFYSILIEGMSQSTRGCLENAILVIVQWLPFCHSLSAEDQQTIDSIPRFDALKFKFFVESFGSLLENIPHDFIETISILSVFDILSAILRENGSSTLSNKTISVLVNLIFHYLMQRRNPAGPIVIAMNKHSQEQILRVLWEISPFCLDLITKKMKDILSGVVQEEGIQIYRGLKAVRMNVSDQNQLVSSIGFLSAIFDMLKKPKKPATRAAQLDLLTSFILSADCSESQKMRDAGRDAYKRVLEILKKTDELEPQALQAMSALIVRCSIDEELDFLIKRIHKCISSSKKKEWCFSCILTLIRGRFVSNYPTWQPSNSISSRDLLLRSSPFMFVPHSNSKIVDFVVSIFNTKSSIRSISTSTTSNIELFLNEIVELIVLVGASNLKLCLDGIIRPLVETEIPFLLLLSMRALSQLIKSDALWEIAPSVRDKASNFYITRETFIQFLQKISLKVLDICNSQANLSSQSLSTFESNSFENAFIVSTAPRNLLPNIAALPSMAETPDSNQLRMSIHRWNDIVSKSTTKRIEELENWTKKTVSSVQNIVETWFSVLCVSPLMVEPCVTPRQLGQTPRSKAKKPKALDNEISLLCKEFLSSQTISPELIENLSGKHMLGISLLHEDEEIVEFTAHTIEKMIVDYPLFRPIIIINIIKLLENADLRKPQAIETLLSHLLAFLDLWVTCLFSSAAASSSLSSNSALLNDEQICQSESVILFCLCSNLPSIQITCLRVLSILPLLSKRAPPPSTTTTSSTNPLLWCSEIFINRELISNSARKYFLKQSAFEISNNIGKEKELSTLTFEQIAASSPIYPRLWSCFLESIGKFSCLNRCGDNVVSKTRTILLSKLSLFNLSDSTTVKSSSFLIWKNMSTLLVSIYGKNEELNSNSSSNNNNNNNPLGSFLQKQIWDNLFEDNGDISDALVSICCQCNYESIPIFINTLMQWWRSVYDSPKTPEKKKGALFFELIALFRSLTDADDFGKTLQLHSDLIWHFVPIFDQFPSGIYKEAEPSLTTTPSSMTTSTSQQQRGRASSALSVIGVLPQLDTRILPFTRFIVNFSRLIRNICKCIERQPNIITQNSIHVHILRPIDGNIWSSESRRTLLEKLIHWNNGGDLITSKTTSPANSTAESLGLIKQIKTASKFAAEAVIRLGPLTSSPSETLPRKIIEWAMEYESSGGKVLQWIIGFHFEKVIPQFLIEIYTSKGGIIYANLIDAIYEHFCHCSNNTEANETATNSAQIQQNKLDENNLFHDLNVYGGALLHLCLRNIGSQSRSIRCQTFTVIDSLAPLGFGSMKTTTSQVSDGFDDSNSIHLRLLSHKGGIKSYESTSFEKHAFGISEVVSVCCSSWAIAVFAQAFSTASSLTIEQKRWALRFLTPWCDNIVLNETTFKQQSSSPSTTEIINVETFLESLFKDFSIDLLNVGHATVVNEFWGRLCKKSINANVPVIVSSLMKFAAQDDRNLPVVKTVLLHLFDTIGDIIPSLIVQFLSFNLSSTCEIESRKLSENNLSNESLKTPKTPATRAATGRRLFQPSEVAALILYEFTSYNFRALIRHLPIILCHSLLQHGEHKSFRELLSVVMENLVVESEQSGRGNGELFEETKKISKRLSNLPNVIISYGETASSTNNRNNHCVKIEIIVKCVCEYLHILDQQVVEAWASESFMWAIGDHTNSNQNIKRETKANRLLRTISTYVGRPRKRLIKDLSISLRDCCESLDQLLLERRNLLIGDEFSSNTSSATTNLDETITCICDKVEEILLSFKQFSETMTMSHGDKKPISLILWSAFACILNPEFGTKKMYNSALELIATLENRNDEFFTKQLQLEDFQPYSQLLHRDGHTHQFIGIQRILFRGILHPSTQQSAVKSIVLLIGKYISTPTNIMSPLSDINRDALSVLGLIPWLLSLLLFVKRRLVVPDFLISTAKELSERLRLLSKLQCPRSIEILKSLSENAGGLIPDSLFSVVSELHDAVFPGLAAECFDILTEMVQYGTPSLAESSLKVIAKLLALRPPDLSKYYKSLLKDVQQSIISNRIVCKASTEVISHLSEMSMCATVQQKEGGPSNANTNTKRNEGDTTGIRGARILRSVKIMRIAIQEFDGTKKKKSGKFQEKEKVVTTGTLTYRPLFKPNSERVCDMPKRAAPKPPLIPESFSGTSSLPNSTSTSVGTPITNNSNTNTTTEISQNPNQNPSILQTQSQQQANGITSTASAPLIAEEEAALAVLKNLQAQQSQTENETTAPPPPPMKPLQLNDAISQTL